MQDVIERVRKYYGEKGVRRHVERHESLRRQVACKFLLHELRMCEEARKTQLAGESTQSRYKNERSRFLEEGRKVIAEVYSLPDCINCDLVKTELEKQGFDVSDFDLAATTDKEVLRQLNIQANCAPVVRICGLCVHPNKVYSGETKKFISRGVKVSKGTE